MVFSLKLNNLIILTIKKTPENSFAINLKGKIILLYS